MRNENRSLGKLEGVKRGAIAAVRYVNRHSDFIHSLDDCSSEIADAFIASLGRAIANQVPRVVSELRDALAQATKEIDIVESSEMIRVLKPQQNAHLA